MSMGGYVTEYLSVQTWWGRLGPVTMTALIPEMEMESKDGTIRIL